MSMSRFSALMCPDDRCEKAICDSLYGVSGLLAMEQKRTAIEMMGIQGGVKRQKATLWWCHGEARLSDGLTKETAKTQLDRFYGDGCVRSLVHDKEMDSARKRRQQGKLPPTCPKRDLDTIWDDDWLTDGIQ